MNSFRQTIKGFVIRIPLNKEYIEKTKGGIYTVIGEEHLNIVRQYAEVIAVNKNSSEVEVGDTLVFHYNSIAPEYKGGRKNMPRNFLSSDDDYNYYYVADGSTHAVIKKDTKEIITLNEYCFIKPYKKEEVKSASGIIVELEKSVEGTDRPTSIITHINNHPELKVGDRVFLPTYTNYEIELPDEKKVWGVKTGFVMAKIVDDD